jgi:hypothetical protein
MSGMKSEMQDQRGTGGSWTKKNGPWANAWAPTWQTPGAGRPTSASEGGQAAAAGPDDASAEALRR